MQLAQAAAHDEAQEVSAAVSGAPEAPLQHLRLEAPADSFSLHYSSISEWGPQAKKYLERTPFSMVCFVEVHVSRSNFNDGVDPTLDNMGWVTAFTVSVHA